MKINNFDYKTFYDFASRITGEDVSLFRHDLELKKSINGVKLSYYVGGESADARIFIFTDDSCEYKNGNYAGSHDLSRKWIMFLAQEICENDVQANYFIDKYNEKLERKIAQYTQEKKDLMIN